MDYEFFPEEELRCKHCGKWAMDDAFMRKLIEARKTANIPFPISSGYRCDEYDAIKEGQGNHNQGKAVDIHCVTSGNRFKIIEALLKVGFVRIGIGKNFIHVDSCEDKPPKVAWLY